MKLALFALASIVGCAFGSLPAHAGETDFDGALSTTPQDIFPAVPGRARLLLQNIDFQTAAGGSGIVEWCRYGTAATAPAAPHAVGSWPLYPGGGRDDVASGVSNVSPVSAHAVNCVAESGAPLLHAEQY